MTPAPESTLDEWIGWSKAEDKGHCTIILHILNPKTTYCCLLIQDSKEK